MPTSIGLDEGDLAGLLSDGSADANFADKFVGDEAVRQISDALASNCSKTRVFLDRNCVGADGAAALGDMLKVNNSIQSLSLEWNSIGTFEQGIQRFADGLEVNGSLTKLILCNNHIGAQGGSYLARALKANSTLAELDLRWNELGNEGARAIRDCLDINRSLTSVKLSGNKVDDYLMENIAAALNDRESGAMEKTVLWDDLQVSRGKAEQLEARLRRQAIEDEAHKRLDREKEKKWQEDIVVAKQDSARHRLDFERQLEASAKQMAVLEEQLIYEQSRAGSLKEKLEKESERRETVQGELDTTKQTMLEMKRELSRQVEKLQDALDHANEDRRITQSELEHMRDILEGEISSLKEELRAANAEIETSRRAATRSVAEAEQATALLETARAEVRLTAERADDAAAAVARVTREGATALEETRRMYEERVETSKMDCDTRARAAEDRVRVVEHERQRAETGRQAANKELARLQVSVEERLSQHERRVLADAQKQFDLELAELRERIDAVHKTRESKEAQAREHLASLEDLRVRSAAELRDFGREITALGEELEKSREATRSHEGKACRLQTEAGVLQRMVEGLQQRAEEAERDRRQVSELHLANTNKIQSQHASELKEGERRLAESRATCTAAEQRAKDVEEQLSTLRQAHLQSLHALERSVGQALVDAVSSARQRGEAA
eukprot:jgi/Undpi1/13907/HiC_scaffold_9.g03558.m1